MDTSDDPTTIALIGMAISGGAAAYSASQNKPESPDPVGAAPTAESGIKQVQEDKKRKRRQSMMASVLTQDWDKPMLSEEGLLGVG